MGSGAEPMLAKEPNLRCSGSHASPHGDPSTECQGTWISSCHTKQKALLLWPLATESNILDRILTPLMPLWLAAVQADSLLLQLPLVTSQKHGDTRLLSSFSVSHGTEPNGHFLLSEVLAHLRERTSLDLCASDPGITEQKLQSY